MNPANDNERLPRPLGEIFIGLAVLFDILGFIFALFFIFAPLIIGAIAGIATAEYCKAHLDWVWLCNQLGYGVGAVSGIATFAVEWFTGIGVAAVAGAGHVLAMVVSILAWLTFTMLFLLRGIWFTGSKHAVRRLVFALGAALGETLPLINLAPLTTISVYYIVKTTRAEDAGLKRKREMQSFDPETSLAAVRQSPRGVQAERLAEYKERLAVQQEGLAIIQARMAEKLQAEPDTSAKEIYDRFVREGANYGMTEKQKKIVSGVAQKYEERRKNIRELRNQYGDDRELYRELFGKYPNGRVQIIEGPASLYVRAFDPTDYARIYNRAFDRPLTSNDMTAAEKTGGISFLKNVRGRERAVPITAENATASSEVESESIRRHEEQHAIKDLFGMRARLRPNLSEMRGQFKSQRSPPDLSQASLRVAWSGNRSGAEDNARDEILAYATQGVAPDQIIKILTMPKEAGGLYDYELLHWNREQARREGYSESDIEAVHGLGPSSEYRKAIESGVYSVGRLITHGYSLEEAKSLLIHEPLHRWPKVVNRLEDAPSSEIGERRKEEQRISRREALRHIAGAAVKGAAFGTAGAVIGTTLTGDTRKNLPPSKWVNPDFLSEGAG